MGDEDKTKDIEGTDPDEPKQLDSEPQGNEEPSDGDGVKDSHGNPGINREKYQRDVKALKDKVDELQAKVDEAAKTEESRNELKAEIEKLRKDAAEKEIEHALELAGCVNLKAAKAVLGDYEGVDALKLKDQPFSGGLQTKETKKVTEFFCKRLC